MCTHVVVLIISLIVVLLIKVQLSSRSSLGSLEGLLAATHGMNIMNLGSMSCGSSGVAAVLSASMLVSQHAVQVVPKWWHAEHAAAGTGCSLNSCSVVNQPDTSLEVVMTATGELRPKCMTTKQNKTS